MSVCVCGRWELRCPTPRTSPDGRVLTGNGLHDVSSSSSSGSTIYILLAVNSFFLARSLYRACFVYFAEEPYFVA